jgi:hypothetical protein
LEEKVAALAYKSENTAIEIRHAYTTPLYPQNLALTLPASGGRYNSFADSGHGVLSFLIGNSLNSGARGSLVVKAIGYKPESREFETR